MRIFSIFHFELSNRFVTEWTILGIPKIWQILKHFIKHKPLVLSNAQEITLQFLPTYLPFAFYIISIYLHQHIYNMYNCINYLQAKSHLSSKRKIWVFTKAARQKFIRVTILWWPCPNLSSLIFTFFKKNSSYQHYIVLILV